MTLRKVIKLCHSQVDIKQVLCLDILDTTRGKACWLRQIMGHIEASVV